MKYIFFYKTKIGNIGIASKDEFITNLYFKEPKNLNDFIIEETEIIKNAYNQLEEYLNGKRKYFDLKFKFNCTTFQNLVYEELQKIPYGKTKSYKDIALSIGNKNAVRAVGMVNNKNPIPIFIPCHRVIGSNGKLIGYAGGLHLKEYLLNFEKK